jgi:hypothetical protein
MLLLEMFSQLEDGEFLQLAWKKEEAKKKNLAPNLLQLIERFNNVTNSLYVFVLKLIRRFFQVSYWVATEIVMQTEARTRVQVLKKFIAVAEVLFFENELLDSNNYFRK